MNGGCLHPFVPFPFPDYFSHMFCPFSVSFVSCPSSLLLFNSSLPLLIHLEGLQCSVFSSSHLSLVLHLAALLLFPLSLLRLKRLLRPHVFTQSVYGFSRGLSLLPPPHRSSLPPSSAPPCRIDSRGGVIMYPITLSFINVDILSHSSSLAYSASFFPCSSTLPLSQPAPACLPAAAPPIHESPDLHRAPACT